MGNNNTSGFQEVETNCNKDDPEKSPKPQVSADDEDHVKGQNEGAAVDESQMVLASDDPVESNEGAADKEVDPPVYHPTAEMTLDEAEGERSELQSLVSSEQLIDHDEPTNSNMDVGEVNKLDCFKKDGKDIMPLQEFKEVNGRTSEEYISDLHTGTRIVEEESGDTTSSMKENDQGLETYLSANQDELDVLCTVLDGKKKQENLTIEEIPSTQSYVFVDVNVTGLKELGEIDRGTGDIVVPESEDRLVVDSLNSESDHLVFGNDMIYATSEETCSEPTEQNSEGVGKKHDPDLNESSLDLDGIQDGGESNASRESATGEEQEACQVSCQFTEAQITEYLEQDASEESCQELEEAKMVVPEFGDENMPSESHNLNGQEGIEEGGLMIRNSEDELAKKPIVEEMEKVSPVVINSAEETEWPHALIPDDDQAPNIDNGSSIQLDHAKKDLNRQSVSLAEEPSEPDSAMPNVKHQESKTCYDLSASVRNPFPEAEKATGRFSTGSNPDSFNSPHLRKSPSFGFDLRIDARSEESDRTPLLFKTTVARSFSSQPTCQYNAVEVEEKVIIRIGRSDSEKSGTHLLEFPNGEAEEARAPKKQDMGNSTSKATKVKHSRRSSFFGGCICCTGVIK